MKVVNGNGTQMNNGYNYPVEQKHPLQSKEWEEFRKQRQPVSKVGDFLVMWTKVPGTKFFFGYIPMGKWPNKKELEDLKAEGKRMRAIGIRMEPNDKLGSTLRLKPGRSLFKTKTLIWDLTKNEDELLKNMHPKGRYNIKVAQRHNVEICEANDQEAFEKYLDLMFEGTARRQRIFSHSRKYHQALWEALKEKIAHLWVAKYEGKIIAADIIFKYGGGMYYTYGASALEHKEVMAPTLLLWEIARWGKQQGCKFFDLWGTEEGTGFSRFKEQFGAEVVELPGSWDLPVNPILYPLFRMAETIRWKIIRLKI